MAGQIQHVLDLRFITQKNTKITQRDYGGCRWSLPLRERLPLLPRSAAAHRAPLSCFREVNVRGDRCGNCGWNGMCYTKCLEE